MKYRCIEFSGRKRSYRVLVLYFPTATPSNNGGFVPVSGFANRGHYVAPHAGHSSVNRDASKGYATNVPTVTPGQPMTAYVPASQVYVYSIIITNKLNVAFQQNTVCGRNF